MSDLSIAVPETSSSTTPDPPIGKPPRHRSGAKWRARFTVLVMVAVAVAAGGYLARGKLTRSAAAASTLDIGTVTLTATPLPVTALKGGRVATVLVHAEQHVSLGAALGTLLVSSTSTAGKATTKLTTLRAPTAGVVADEPIAVGNSLQDGQAFAVLYDPANLTLVADVPLQELTKLKQGMTATLRGAGLTGSIKAIVRRAVPRVGGNQSGVAANEVQLVLSPAKSADVADLLPGMQFTGRVSIEPGGAGSRANLLTSK